MPVLVDRFLRLRPFLYHLTDTRNVRRIVRTRRIESAAPFTDEVGAFRETQEMRRAHVSIIIDGEEIAIRDQAPLHQGNMKLADGYTFSDFVALLNERVFFWPGSAAGPISYGVRHHGRYAHEQPTIIRVSTADLFAANPSPPPSYCRFNSGSPRCSNGLKSPRSVRTFVHGDGAEFRAAQVVEVTFSDGVNLPDHVEVSTALDGPWNRIK
jgi:hypothetical protein